MELLTQISFLFTLPLFTFSFGIKVHRNKLNFTDPREGQDKASLK